jgi:hypothetical protein
MGNNIICSSHLLKASSKHFESNLGISSPALIKSDIKKIYYLFKTPIGPSFFLKRTLMLKLLKAWENME